MMKVKFCRKKYLPKFRWIAKVRLYFHVRLIHVRLTYCSLVEIIFIHTKIIEEFVIPFITALSFITEYVLVYMINEYD